METIAVYWEPKISIYGFCEKTGLSLCRIRIPSDRVAAWGNWIEKNAETAGGFVLTTAHMTDSETLELSLLYDGGKEEAFHQAMETKVRREPEAAFSIEAPVELLYFQGPHFGDRYGIADAAFGALAKENVEVLSGVCTGASIYIVLPEGQILRATGILSRHFAVPASDTGAHEKQG